MSRSSGPTASRSQGRTTISRSANRRRITTGILVFYVLDKWFCFVNAVAWDFCNLRCAPERIPELRERYEGIGPGWHMNKKHWISVRFDSDVPGELLKELVRQSYELATAHLTKKQRAELAEKDKQL